MRKTMDGGSYKTPQITAARIKRAVAFTSLLLVSIYFASCSGGPAVNENSNSNQAQASDQPTLTATPLDPNIDYSKFTHSNETHANLPCLLCHKNEGPTVTKIGFPGTPNHLPCAGCHVQQFNDPKSPMCSICHTDPASGEMKQFPPIRSFDAKFDHQKHVPQAKCATCHKPIQNGVGFSVPTRASSHATCFQCHGTEAAVAKTMAERGTNIDSCSTCHEAGNPGPAHTMAKYAGGFNHARHVNAKGISCSSCHTLRAGTGDNQVSAPAMLFHRATGKTQSCATCHNDKRAFGTANFANCDRCHQGNTFAF